MCNKALTTCEFPTCLKYAEVKPLFKSGESTELSNYRPISVLTSFSKMFEKIIYKRLYHHLKYNNILVNQQFGFRKNLSTTMATYRLLKEISDALNSNSVVGGIFCDLKKAFNCVNHDILLSKMEFYGIKGIFNKLIRSYLSNRYQRVSINKNFNKYSDWKPIHHGVPQGSILDADDTSIIILDKDSLKFKTKVHTVFDKINNWFQTNLLTLNFDKTNFLQFLTKNSHELDVHVSYENRQIVNIYNIKFLRLSMDSSLSWKNHIDHLIYKLNKSCYVLRSIKSILSLESIKMVYFSYVHSLLTYGIIF
jgi:hypothetical protein